MRLPKDGRETILDLTTYGQKFELLVTRFLKPLRDEIAKGFEIGDEELSKVTFMKGNQKPYIITNFTEDLQGIRSYSYGLHNTEIADVTKYNSWNFTNITVWDSVAEGFWYSINTTVVY